MPKASLTDRQRSILVFLREFVEDNGYPPTLREIGANFGIKSPRGVQDHLVAIERKGSRGRIVADGLAAAERVLATELTADDDRSDD